MAPDALQDQLTIDAASRTSRPFREARMASAFLDEHVTDEQLLAVRRAQSDRRRAVR